MATLPRPIAGRGLEAWLAEAWAQQPEIFTVIGDDGVSLACRGWNLGVRDKPALLLVHGFRAHAGWWDHIAPHLAAGRQVVALDLSGMGDSGARPAYSRLAHSRDILSVIERAALDAAIVIAHSYGGQAALVAAASAPELFRRLIVIDSKIPLSNDNSAVRDLPARRYPSRAAAVARFRLTPVSKSPVPAIIARVADSSLCEATEGWRWKIDDAITENFDNDNCHSLMHNQRVPIDLIYGEDSTVVTAERLAALRGMAPLLGEPVGIPFASHHIMLEEPVALVCALRGLLARDELKESPL